jgi:cytochrome c553
MRVKGRGSRIMKLISLQLAVQTTILAIVISAAGQVDAADKAAHSRRGPQARTDYRGPQAKIEYCTDCHGSAGQGYQGYLTMPRLAGQQAVYFENQLLAFVEHRRDNNLFLDMGKVHGLSPEMRTAMATYFRDLDTGPVGGGPRTLVATGKKFFEEGDPEGDVPACSSCHGPEAKGQGAIPRLAGQLYPYLVRELTNWSKERGQGSAKDDTSAIMAPIAQRLTQSQIAALAAYLNYLK